MTRHVDCLAHDNHMTPFDGIDDSGTAVQSVNESSRTSSTGSDEFLKELTLRLVKEVASAPVKPPYRDTTIPRKSGYFKRTII